MENDRKLNFGGIFLIVVLFVGLYRVAYAICEFIFYLPTVISKIVGLYKREVSKVSYPENDDEADIPWEEA